MEVKKWGMKIWVEWGSSYYGHRLWGFKMGRRETGIIFSDNLGVKNEKLKMGSNKWGLKNRALNLG